MQLLDTILSRIGVLTAAAIAAAVIAALTIIADAEADHPVEIAISATAACALTEAGEIVCWGWDIPLVQHPPAGTFTDLSLGPTDACAINTDGAAVCWGAGYEFVRTAVDSILARDPQFDLDLAGLGQMLPPQRTDLVEVAVHPWRHYACARSADGEIVCWGRPLPNSPAPARAGFTELISTGREFCALDSNGAVSCWSGMTFHDFVSVIGRFVRIDASGNGFCGALEDGSIRCRTADSRDAPGPPPEFAQLFRNVHVIGSQGCSIDADGAMQCRQAHHWCDHLVPKDVDYCPPPELIRYQAWPIPFTTLFEGGPNRETTATRSYTQLFRDQAACAITDTAEIDCWSDFRRGDPRHNVPQRFRPTGTEPVDPPDQPAQPPSPTQSSEDG